MKNHLTANDELTKKLRTIGIKNWSELIEYIQELPYGRTSNRTDLSLVISEQKGTCSSKHALLKQVADLNDIKGIQLVIGIYKMSEANTPGIGTHLSDNGLSYIPEAHCYIKIDNSKLDLTNEDSTLTNIESEILEETEILPIQVGTYKIKYHQDYIRHWLAKNNLSHTFEEVWKIRELCIKNLSNS